MRLTNEMIQEDDKRFKRQNLLAEFNYCGKEVPKRKSITNDDIRFYAWLCRSAYTLLKEKERTLKEGAYCEMDREKVIKALEERISTCSMVGDGFDVTLNWRLADDILALLKEREAVKPVKLVHCKNCRHCDSERIDKNMIWCKIHQFGRPDDHYCADGIEK